MTIWSCGNITTLGMVLYRPWFVGKVKEVFVNSVEVKCMEHFLIKTVSAGQ